MINLRRKHRREHVEPWREKQAGQFLPICRRAARWAADNLEALQDAEPELPNLGTDRGEDNWSSLLAVADLAGGRWSALAREAARVLTKAEAVDDEVGILLLEDVRDIFAEKNADRLPTAELVEALVSMEERPWGEWRKGKPITPSGLARLLRPFEVGSKNIKLATGRVVKGYYLDILADAFKRYLPDSPLSNRYSATEAEVKANSGESNRYQSNAVADEKTDIPFEKPGGSGVADETPPDCGNGKDEAPGQAEMLYRGKHDCRTCGRCDGCELLAQRMRDNPHGALEDTCERWRGVCVVDATRDKNKPTATAGALEV
jgi:hypothetical protein